MTVDGKVREMGHNWSCPICQKFLRCVSNLDDKDSIAEARRMLQWGAINHLATHISDCSAPTVKEEV